MADTRLGRYILDRRLAKGGMAEVFLARQVGPEGYARRCVVKRVLPLIAGDGLFVRMFLDEARLTSQLSHPNIAQIFDFGEERGTYYLAMEYIDGVSLLALIERCATFGELLPCPAVARIVADAARALDSAHNARGTDGEPLNIIHRDVSPQNILLSRGGVVKLIDFGIAKADNAQERTGVGIIKGKYAYMSPEQITSQPLDRRTDIYALGLVFYELLTLRAAIRGADPQALMSAAALPQFQPIQKLRPDVPLELVRICERALAVRREERYLTAQELSQDLDAYLRTVPSGLDQLIGLLPPAIPEPAPPVAAPPLDDTYVRDDSSTLLNVRRRRTVWLAGAALGAVALAALGAFLLHERTVQPVALVVPAPSPLPEPLQVPRVVVPPRPLPVEAVRPSPSVRAPVRHPGAEHRRPAPPVAAAPAAVPPGVVEFRAAPFAEVFQGEKSLGVTPFKPLELAQGHYQFKLVNPQTGRTAIREIDVQPGSRQTVAVDLSAP